MWRRKQGKDDWQDSAEPTEDRRANTLTLDGSGLWRSRLGDHREGQDGGVDVDNGGEEEEWDIERAVERRVVQVMFTVPKEKLRVVNQDIQDESSETGSLTDSIKIIQPSEAEIIAAPTEVEQGQEQEGRRNGSPVSSKGKGRVQEIVERLEGWKD
jgi:hypothetical protein